MSELEQAQARVRVLEKRLSRAQDRLDTLEETEPPEPPPEAYKLVSHSTSPDDVTVVALIPIVLVYRGRHKTSVDYLKPRTGRTLTKEDISSNRVLIMRLGEVELVQF